MDIHLYKENSRENQISPNSEESIRNSEMPIVSYGPGQVLAIHRAARAEVISFISQLVNESLVRCPLGYETQLKITDVMLDIGSKNGDSDNEAEDSEELLDLQTVQQLGLNNIITEFQRETFFRRLVKMREISKKFSNSGAENHEKAFAMIKEAALAYLKGVNFGYLSKGSIEYTESMPAVKGDPSIRDNEDLLKLMTLEDGMLIVKILSAYSEVSLWSFHEYDSNPEDISLFKIAYDSVSSAITINEFFMELVAQSFQDDNQTSRFNGIAVASRLNRVNVLDLLWNDLNRAKRILNETFNLQNVVDYSTLQAASDTVEIVYEKYRNIHPTDVVDDIFTPKDTELDRYYIESNHIKDRLCFLDAVENYNNLCHEIVSGDDPMVDEIILKQVDLMYLKLEQSMGDLPENDQLELLTLIKNSYIKVARKYNRNPINEDLRVELAVFKLLDKCTNRLNDISDYAGICNSIMEFYNGFYKVFAQSIIDEEAYKKYSVDFGFVIGCMGFLLSANAESMSSLNRELNGDYTLFQRWYTRIFPNSAEDVLSLEPRPKPLKSKLQRSNGAHMRPYSDLAQYCEKGNMLRFLIAALNSFNPDYRRSQLSAEQKKLLEDLYLMHGVCTNLNTRMFSINDVAKDMLAKIIELRTIILEI